MPQAALICHLMEYACQCWHTGLTVHQSEQQQPNHPCNARTITWLDVCSGHSPVINKFSRRAGTADGLALDTSLLSIFRDLISMDKFLENILTERAFVNYQDEFRDNFLRLNVCGSNI